MIVGAGSDLNVIGADGDERAGAHGECASGEGQAATGEGREVGPGGCEGRGARDRNLVLGRAVAQADGVGGDGHERPGAHGVDAATERQAVASEGGEVGPRGREVRGARDWNLVLRRTVAEADSVGGDGHERASADGKHTTGGGQAISCQFGDVAPAWLRCLTQCR